MNTIDNENNDMGNTTVTQNATTTFLDDAGTSKALPHNEVSIPRQYFTAAESSASDSIFRFLNKPIEIATGDFSATDVASTFPGPYQMPFTMLNNNVYWPKLLGYFGFRATMVFTLQVNGQRFQQGRYMLVYVPTGGTTSDANALSWFNSHAATLVARSQCPHVELDVNKDTSVQLRIPFNSSHDFYPLQYGISSTSTKWGNLRIFPYVPLQAGSGSLTAKYTLWAHFEDIDVVGQALPIERQSNSMAEAKSKGVGPIQSTALKVKMAAGVLKNVPLIGTYVSPVAWVADIVGNVASIFGLSSPANVDKQYRVETSLMSYATNLDKVDKTNPLSYSLKSAVGLLPGEGFEDADEMHIKHIASRYAYQAFFYMNDVQVEEDLITSYLVGLYPTGGPLTHVDGGVTMTDYTPAQWLGKRFEMYRGSMKYRFKIVKTDFHSGRISIDFNPEARSYISPPMLDTNAPYIHRQIIDIRDFNEFEIEFPFISPNPYIGTYNNGNTHFGRIEIRVVDPLVAPATVASNITFIMEVAMSDDAEFAGRSNHYCRIYDTIEVQSNSMTIGSTTPLFEQNDTAKYCIGEKIINVRALLKRYESLHYESAGEGVPGGDFRPYNFGTLHSVLPFCSSRFRAGAADNIAVDLYSELASIYTYARGSVRLKINVEEGRARVDGVSIPQAEGQNTVLVLNSGNFSGVNTLRNVGALAAGTIPVKQPLPNLFTNTQEAINTSQFTLIQNSRDKTLEVEVPQWIRQHSRNNAMYSTGVPQFACTVDDETSKYFVQVFKPDADELSIQAGHGFSMNVLRAGGDDCNFTGFVSIPPMEIIYQGPVTLV